MCPSRRGCPQGSSKPRSCGPPGRPSRKYPRRSSCPGASALAAAQLEAGTLGSERRAGYPLPVFAQDVPVRHTHSRATVPLHVSNQLIAKASRRLGGWRADWITYDCMVVYNRGGQQAHGRELSPRCPKCDSPRTEIIGMSTSHNATFLRCGGCGARSQAPLRDNVRPATAAAQA